MNREMFRKHNASIGYEFEFYSEKNKREVRKELKEKLGKKIVFVDDPKASDYSRDIKEGSLILTIDKSGGIDMYEVITPPLSYIEAISVFKKISNWIDEFGYTTKHSGIHINISLKDVNIKNIDIFKFILSFKEEYVYEIFPKRKNNIYCNSIKMFYPKNLHMKFLPEYKHNFNYPMTKYFGVNFEKLKSNYLEYRYLGGANYQRKVDEIITLTDYFIEHLCNVVKDNKLTVEDKVEFQRIVNPMNKLKTALQSLETFRLMYPKIHLYVDLSSDDLKIKTFWSLFVSKLFVLLHQNSIIGEVDINYNTDKSLFEVANNDKIRGIHLFNFGFYNCTLTGILTNCIIKESILQDASAYSSFLVNSKLNDSKIYNSDARFCDFNNVYVSNPDTNRSISGEFNEGIIATSNVIKNDFYFNEQNKRDGLIMVVSINEI